MLDQNGWLASLHGGMMCRMIGTWYARLRSLIDGEARAAGISNLIERDVVLKEAMGFDEAHFTRLWQVLRPV